MLASYGISGNGSTDGMGYSNNTGDNYIYGPRVPLLVVSAYARQGYISGGSTPSCPGATCHDFGSILGYIEHVFNLADINPSYRYADYLAPDGVITCPSCSYPLADFFGTTKNSFTPINGAKYPPPCFHNPKQSGCWGGSFTPQNPDNDADDD